MESVELLEFCRLIVRGDFERVYRVLHAQPEVGKMPSPKGATRPDPRRISYRKFLITFTPATPRFISPLRHYRGRLRSCWFRLEQIAVQKTAAEPSRFIMLQMATAVPL